MSIAHAPVCNLRENRSLRVKLNAEWHERGLQVFTAIVLAAA